MVKEYGASIEANINGHAVRLVCQLELEDDPDKGLRDFEVLREETAGAEDDSERGFGMPSAMLGVIEAVFKQHDAREKRIANE